MTVVQPNSISGITSLSCTGDSLSIHDSGGNLVRTLITGGGDVVSGVLTVAQIGSATDTLTIPGNLTVQGTRTILNTDELNINDKLVGIASTATPSSLSQDNAGLTIYGQTNVDLKYEVKKAAVGLNTALCVAGFVTSFGGLNAAGGLNVGTAATISTNGNASFSGIVTATKFVVGAAATISTNGNASFSGISTFAGVSLSGTSESSILTQAASAGGTTDLEFETADNFIITMGGNTSMTAGNQKVGQSGSIFMVQDGTGSRTASWHADFKWTGGTAPTLTTTAAAIDRIDYFVKASNQIHAVASLDVK